MATAAVNSIASSYRFLRCSSSSPSSALNNVTSVVNVNKKKGLSGSSIPILVHGSSKSRRALEAARRTRDRGWAAASRPDDADIIPLQRSDSVEATSLGVILEREWEDRVVTSSSDQVAGFAFQSGGDVAGFSSSSSPTTSLEEKDGGGDEEDMNRLVDRTINATVALAAGTFAVTKILTVDHDYWHGWTIFEILRYAPQHNWIAYEEALKANPVLAKMMISGIVYSVGDWIAQCYEGKPLLEFDRARIFRSGLVGFTLHGSLSHYYYHFCEALFPFEAWWVVPAKVVFDQTVWSAIWNSIYFVVLGFLRFESPLSIYSELTSTFWPMLTAGWKLWPFAHLITYGVVPVEQRLLWVDCVELVWVTILSTYSNEKSEAKNTEATLETDTTS